jgi:hypothetical protein
MTSQGARRHGMANACRNGLDLQESGVSKRSRTSGSGPPLLRNGEALGGTKGVQTLPDARPPSALPPPGGIGLAPDDPRNA